MSRNESVDHALGRARQARARLAPAAAKVKPLADKAGAATARRVRKTRSWAAPQVKRAGEVLAPKVAAMMSSAAERIDPDQPRHGSSRFTSAARAAAARLLRGRTRRASAASKDDAD